MTPGPDVKTATIDLRRFAFDPKSFHRAPSLLSSSQVQHQSGEHAIRQEDDVAYKIREPPRLLEKTSPSSKRPHPCDDTNGTSKRRKTSTSSPKKKRGYASPDVYAHLNVLQDYLKENVDVVFCGINPGFLSAQSGHHFANPTNHFWRCLHRSGFTNRLLPPSEDHTLPELYNLGLTNLVDRPSREEAELSKDEMVASVPNLLYKIAKYRPRIVCFVGRGIWTNVEKAFLAQQHDSPNPSLPKSSLSSASALRLGWSTKVKKTRGHRSALPWRYGLQSYVIRHPTLESSQAVDVNAVKNTFFYVTPSTSGRVTSHQLPAKVILFESLREKVKEHMAGEIDHSCMIDISVETSEEQSVSI